MPNFQQYYKKMIFALSGIVFLFPFYTFASTLFEFNIATTSSSYFGFGTTLYQDLGTPLQYATGMDITGVVRSTEITLSNNGLGVSQALVFVWGTTCGSSSLEIINIPASTASTTYLVNFSVPLNINNCTGILAQNVIWFSGEPIAVWGSSQVFNPPDGPAGSVSGTTTIKDMQLRIRDTQSITTSYIIQSMYPQNNTATSTAPLFKFEYFNGTDEYDYACIKVEQFGGTDNFGTCQNMVSNGIFIFQSGGLHASSTYLWQPHLEISGSTTKIYGEWRTFYTGNLNDFVDKGYIFAESEATTTEATCGDHGGVIHPWLAFRWGICSSFDFLFYPNKSNVIKFQTIDDKLFTKFPFSFANDIYVLLNNLATTTYATTTLQASSTILGLPFDFSIDLQEIGQLQFIQYMRTTFSYILYVTWSIGLFVFAINIL